MPKKPPVGSGSIAPELLKKADAAAELAFLRLRRAVDSDSADFRILIQTYRAAYASEIAAFIEPMQAYMSARGLALEAEDAVGLIAKSFFSNVAKYESGPRGYRKWEQRLRKTSLKRIVELHASVWCTEQIKAAASSLKRRQ